MKILVVIPTQTELDFFLQACHSRGYQAQAIRIGNLTTTCFPELEMVVAEGGLGKTQFALQTQHLIDMAHWDLVICTGAAGALVNDLSIGNVVIATESVEHDIKNKFGKPLLPRFNGAENILELCRQTLQSGPAFHVHFGPIASGDEDVVESERREAIRKQTGALALAWEGAGGARAAQFSGVPYIEIRGVTDSANSTAALDFELNVKKAMQNVAHIIMSWHFLVLITEKQERTKVVNSNTSNTNESLVTLQPVNHDNWREVTKLEVTESQREFVAEPSYYLALCNYVGDWQPLAIYLGEQVIGFMMWAVDEADGSCWLGGILIDQNYQRKGYGRKAIQTVIGMLSDKHGYQHFALSYSPENSAKHLYHSLGFIETDEWEGDEIVARLSIEK